MGKVLEMKLRLVSLLTSAALLSACNLPVLKSAVPMIAAAAGAATAPSTPTTTAAPDAPQIWLTLKSRGVKFPMAQIANHDGVKIFASNDGSQVFLKNGVLVGTRGFGRDLMSADTVAPANLKVAAEYHRDFFDMDGTDTMIRHSNRCLVEALPTAEGAATVSEACASDIGTIHNEYWLGSGQSIVKSKQWVSQGVGYAIIEPKTD
jgi:Group 4 capsule polysaccharide lipoprotein gfcB, YjbF